MKIVVSTAALLAACAIYATGVSTASADPLHYDVGFGVGPSKRFLGNKPTGGDDSAVGALAQFHADVALFPLIKVGLYAGFELSPPPTADVREMFPFGAQIKIAPPIDSNRFKLYLFAGFGYNAVYTHSYRETIPLQNAQGELVPTPARLEGVSGSFFEIPFGVGGSYKLRKPWELFMELRATAGFGFGATLYNFEDTGGRPGQSLDGKGVATGTDNDGEEVFGLALVFGVQYDK